MSNPIKTIEYAELLKNIKERITEARYKALKTVNKELIALYWDIGRLIVERQTDKSWGKSVVQKLAKDLQVEFLGIKRLSILDTESLCIFQARLLSKCRIAHLLLRMPEIIATLCSVKAIRPDQSSFET